MVPRAVDYSSYRCQKWSLNACLNVRKVQPHFCELPSESPFAEGSQKVFAWRQAVDGSALCHFHHSKPQAPSDEGYQTSFIWLEGEAGCHPKLFLGTNITRARTLTYRVTKLNVPSENSGSPWMHCTGSCNQLRPKFNFLLAMFDLFGVHSTKMKGLRIPVYVRLQEVTA